MVKINAFIPIKMNNERLPNKNTKKLNNIPLVNYPFLKLLDIDSINKCILYCSTHEIEDFILPEVLKHPKYEFIMRNKNLDTPETTCNDFITAFINDMDDESIDFIFLLHSTQPLVSQNTINNICDNLKTKKYDSAFTAKQYKQYSWYGGKPLNYDKYNIPRTQDINPVIIETTGLYVFSQEMYKKDRCRIGDMPYIKIVNEIEGIDIDTKEDFKLAKLICEGNYL